MSSKNKKDKTGRCSIYYNGEFSKSFKYTSVPDRKRKLEQILKQTTSLTGIIEIIIAPDVPNVI